jgi:hypothetical protein
MPWDFDRIGEIIKEAAREPSQEPRSRHGDNSLDRYSGNNVPGQLWDKYKIGQKSENGSIGLREKLESLLAPSTTKDRLEALRRNAEEEDDKWSCTFAGFVTKKHKSSAYLRLKQKPTRQEEWLVDPQTGKVHNGAHFPLLMFTNNPSARSKAADERRKSELAAKQRGARGQTAWRMRQAGSDTPAWMRETLLRDTLRDEESNAHNQFLEPVSIVPAGQAATTAEQVAVAAETAGQAATTAGQVAVAAEVEQCRAGAAQFATNSHSLLAEEDRQWPWHGDGSWWDRWDGTWRQPYWGWCDGDWQSDTRWWQREH